MKLLFVHDHKFYEESDIYYSSACFPENIWDRYLDEFSSITVIGRKLINKKLGLVKSSKNRVEFRLIN